MSNPYLTPREAADHLRRSLSSVRALIRRGRLKAKRVRGSRLLLIPLESVEALLEDVCSDEASAQAQPALRVVDGGRREDSR